MDPHLNAQIGPESDSLSSAATCVVTNGVMLDGHGDGGGGGGAERERQNEDTDAAAGGGARVSPFWPGQPTDWPLVLCCLNIIPLSIIYGVVMGYSL